jgi:ankyrin repeat protein
VRDDGFGSQAARSLTCRLNPAPCSRPPWSMISDPSALRAHLATDPSVVNAFSPSGLTLLHLAADADLALTVSVLLELGADRDLRDRAPVDSSADEEEEEGMTAREMAEINGFDRVVALLA